jgi:hypothetical protein
MENNMERKHAIIGTWTKQDGLKEWDLLLGPITLEEANEKIAIVNKISNVIDQDEFIVSWEVYKLMLQTLTEY